MCHGSGTGHPALDTPECNVLENSLKSLHLGSKITEHRTWSWFLGEQVIALLIQPPYVHCAVTNKNSSTDVV